MPKSIPTEREVRRCIYVMYEASLPVEGLSAGKVIVSIDVDAVTERLPCDQHILFGYLYYHLDHKYRYSAGDNLSVHLFAPRSGELRHAIKLPYLAAIFAGQDQEFSTFIWSLGLSLVALALSVGAIIAQLVAAR